RAVPAVDGQGSRRTVTTPVLPSTRTRSPVRIALVPRTVPTTAGRPYSRHAIAACDMIPPVSTTAATIRLNTTPQVGAVTGQTSTSPSCTVESWSTERITRAGPSAVPG